MRDWTPQQVAAAAGATMTDDVQQRTGPERVTIDSRDAGPGALFIGLVGEHHDGGEFATQALAAGAWGALVAPAHADTSATRARAHGA